MRVSKREPISWASCGVIFLLKKARHVLGLHRQHRLAGKLFVERLERLGGAKHEVRGILHLHQAPVIALIKGVHDRTAQLGEAIENPMQLLGRERIGEGLRPLPVVDAQKGVVGEGKADAGGGKLARQRARVRCNRTAAGRGARSARAGNIRPTFVIDEISRSAGACRCRA